MNKQQKSYNQRFPYGRDSWRFMKPRKLALWEITGELSLASMSTYDAVEITAEIVEQIYRMGWDDARDAAREVVAHEL